MVHQAKRSIQNFSLHLNKLLLATVLTVSVTSQAAYNPLIEKPVQKAQTDIIAVEGSFVGLNVQTATVTKLIEDGSDEVKFAIQFGREDGLVAMAKGQMRSIIVDITDIEPTSCGVLYVGKYKNPSNPQNELLLHVYDTAQNTENCRVLDQWNIILESYTSQGLIGKVEMAGVPVSIIKPTIVYGLGHYDKLPLIE